LSGEHLTIPPGPNAASQPRARAHPGRVNRRRALGNAARHADIIGLAMLGQTPEDGQRHEVRWQADRLDRAVDFHSGAGRRTRRQAQAERAVQSVVLTDDRDAATRNLAAKVAGLSAEDALATPLLALGTHDEITEHLLACRQRWGISHFTMRELDAFPPVIERLDATVASRS
jgi:hypothetical protein